VLAVIGVLAFAGFVAGSWLLAGNPAYDTAVPWLLLLIAIVVIAMLSNDLRHASQ
jgi:hypothetical protein